MKAKKLPSGSWRVRVYDYTDSDKKKHYKSFTCDDKSSKGKAKCEKMAAEWVLNKSKHEEEKKSIILDSAIEQYISNKENVLSVATVRGYNAILRQLRKDYKDLLGNDINALNSQIMQSFVNEYSKEHGSKTVRNVFGLISATIYSNRDDIQLKVTMPQKVKKERYVPTDDDIKKLLKHIEGTELEIPVLLGAFGMMRRSEISGLSIKDISKDGVAHVHQAKVKNKDEQFVYKTTKTVSSDRYVDLPDFVVKKIKEKGYITKLTSDEITKKFSKALDEAEIPHFRFHDLRHYSASIRHFLGIPDSFIQEQGGWSSDVVLKQVYRHAMSDKQKEMNNKANNYFSNLVN